MAELLTDDAVRAALAEFDGWHGNRSGIERTVELASFPDAISVVVRVAEVAEEMDHHPDIDIRWRSVTMRCATHSKGGVTDADVELARRIDQIVSDAI